MLNKSLAILLLTVLSPFASAEDQTVPISPACLEKVAKLADAFATANQMYFGKETSVKIGSVTVNPSATTIGESGFARGTGSYQMSVEFGGEEPIVETVEFNFGYAMEPHCAVMTIQATGWRG